MSTDLNSSPALCTDNIARAVVASSSLEGQIILIDELSSHDDTGMIIHTPGVNFPASSLEAPSLISAPTPGIPTTLSDQGLTNEGVAISHQALLIQTLPLPLLAPGQDIVETSSPSSYSLRAKLSIQDLLPLV
ncbi:hypothetical protein NL676_034961 [Syzygium grande]|nr:hypothetical protein NL676_034961 [Syzygium grande]